MFVSGLSNSNYFAYYTRLFEGKNIFPTKPTDLTTKTVKTLQNDLPNAFRGEFHLP